MSFPFDRQPGVSRKQVRAFAELDFVPRAENIVFIGGTGVGKTGLASGLLLKALQNGYRGLFIPEPVRPRRRGLMSETHQTRLMVVHSRQSVSQLVGHRVRRQGGQDEN